MAKNFVQPGDVIEVVAPANHSSGDGVKVGTFIFGVAQHDALSGEPLSLGIEGVYSLPKIAGLVVAEGDRLGWDEGNAELVADGAGSEDIKAGIAVKVALGGDAEAKVKLERP